MDVCEGGGLHNSWGRNPSVVVLRYFSLGEIDSALEGRRSRALQKQREEERVSRREYALILVSRLNFTREVATLIVLFAAPAGVYNSGQACDLIVVDDVVSGGRV